MQNLKNTLGLTLLCLSLLQIVTTITDISDYRYFLRTWSHLLKKSLTENFIFCALLQTTMGVASCDRFLL